jgi:hypothetical protein
MPRGHGLPPLRPDGAVAKGPEFGGLGDEVDDNDDQDVDDESPSSHSERWVSKIRHAWLFWSGQGGSWGPLAPVVSVEGGPRAAAVSAMAYS